jgi:hypothetical protein
VIARITRHRTPPATVPWLVTEVVALARARSHSVVRDPERTAEFFFVDTPTGRALSVVLGTSRTVVAAIDVEGTERGEAAAKGGDRFPIDSDRPGGFKSPQPGWEARCDGAWRVTASGSASSATAGSRARTSTASTR